MTLWIKVVASVIAITSLTSTTLHAQWLNYYRRPNVIGSFMPENNFNIPVGQVRNSEIDEKMFNLVIDRVEKIYAPIVAAKGLKLEIERKWTDGTVNAYAQRMGTTAHVAMFGGLARHEMTTQDGFALVVCHEIGHHIAGHPKISGMGWASNEGQSDYFGTLKCMRKVLRGMDNYIVAKRYYDTRRDIVDEHSVQACLKSWGQTPDRDLCVRIAAAGKSLANLLATLRRSPLPNFNTPDTSRVNRTNDRHPEAQCRLDTYFNGALCPVSDTEDLDDVNPNAGACTAARNFNFGMRPACWYASAQSFYLQ